MYTREKHFNKHYDKIYKVLLKNAEHKSMNNTNNNK